MKRLFDENDRYTESASELATRVDRLLAPVIAEMVRDGYSIRDVEYVINASTTVLCIEHLLVRRSTPTL